MKPQVLLPFYTFAEADHAATVRMGVTVAAHVRGEIDALLIDVEIPRVENFLANKVLDLPGLAGEIRAKCRDTGTQITDAFAREIAEKRISFRVEQASCAQEDFARVLANEARYRDIVVCGLAGSESSVRRLAEVSVFESSRPTILVPEGATGSAFDHVAIAWDGSRVAAKAVSDAHLFMARAKTITVISVDDEKPLGSKTPGHRLAEYLKRTGRPATVARIQGKGGPISDTLQDHAGAIGAGLLVMGGFGHSRLRDFILGGATTGVFGSLKMPVLMSH